MSRTGYFQVVAVVSILLTGCVPTAKAPLEAAPAAEALPAPDAPRLEQVSADGLTLTITPQRPYYALRRAAAGNVAVVARFENSGSREVLLAHPNVGHPPPRKTGKIPARKGDQAAISILIERPDGSWTLVHNNNLRLFEPGNRDHRLIPPGEAREILLGWLGPEFSLGQWAGIDQPLFATSGDYRLTVRYRNAWPAASISDVTGRYSIVAPWSGELVSNTVTVSVR